MKEWRRRWWSSVSNQEWAAPSLPSSLSTKGTARRFKDLWCAEMFQHLVSVISKENKTIVSPTIFIEVKSSAAQIIRPLFSLFYKQVNFAAWFEHLYKDAFKCFLWTLYLESIVWLSTEFARIGNVCLFFCFSQWTYTLTDMQQSKKNKA